MGVGSANEVETFVLNLPNSSPLTDVEGDHSVRRISSGNFFFRIDLSGLVYRLYDSSLAAGRNKGEIIFPS